MNNDDLPLTQYFELSDSDFRKFLRENLLVGETKENYHVAGIGHISGNSDFGGMFGGGNDSWVFRLTKDFSPKREPK